VAILFKFVDVPFVLKSNPKSFPFPEAGDPKDAV